jgi:hypothetical protein
MELASTAPHRLCRRTMSRFLRLQDTYRKMTKPRDELRKALRKVKEEEAVKA